MQEPMATAGGAERDPALVDVACHHFALVAIDGASDETALTISPSFRLHIGTLDTDRTGYLALIAARHAAHGERPPLDVLHLCTRGNVVTAHLEPRCLAHLRVEDDVVSEMWLTPDWDEWTGSGSQLT